MFDSKLCDRWLPKSPFFIEWLKFLWHLDKLLLVALFLLAFLALRWLIFHTRWNPWFKSRRFNLLLFSLTAILPIIILIGLDNLIVRFLPTDTGAVADAIVVLGRGSISNEQRINSAAELWQARRAPLIFLTGRGDAQTMSKQLEEKGIPPQALDGENCALTTLQNAIFTAAILHQQGLQKILLITDEPHMLRALILFKNQDFTIISHPIPLPDNWSLKQKMFIAFRELIGLVSYGFRGLLFSRNSPELNTIEIVGIKQRAEQYGQQKKLRQRAYSQGKQKAVKSPWVRNDESLKKNTI